MGNTYKVGDQVRIRKDMVLGQKIGNVLVTQEMVDVAAQDRVYTVTEVFSADGDKRKIYELYPYAVFLLWIPEMLIPADKESEAAGLAEDEPDGTQTEAVESCPYCEGECVFPNWDTSTRGYVAKCQHCGEEIMLCDECRHADDNPDMKCDWHEELAPDGCMGVCFRGITHHKTGMPNGYPENALYKYGKDVVDFCTLGDADVSSARKAAALELSVVMGYLKNHGIAYTDYGNGINLEIVVKDAPVLGSFSIHWRPNYPGWEKGYLTGSGFALEKDPDSVRLPIFYDGKKIIGQLEKYRDAQINREEKQDMVG